jgi:hypothetical protein
MTAVAIVVIVVAAIIIVAQARSARASRAHARDLAAIADEARAARRRAEERLADEARHVAELTVALDDARRAASEPAPAPAASALVGPNGDGASDLAAGHAEATVAPTPDKAPAAPLGERAGAEEVPAPSGEAPVPVAGSRAATVLEALWALTTLERARAQRYAEAVSTAPARPGHADGLAASLEDEVSRLREEAGTPGSLRVALEAEPRPGDSELLLRSVHTLLGVLSRHCQAYDLYVHEWDGRLLAVLVCEGFDGPDSVADDATEVLVALAPVDGRLELDRDAQGRLRARLSIPAGR